MVDDSSLPTRATLVNWMRLNLAMTLGLVGFALSAMGGVWAASAWTADLRSQITGARSGIADNARRIEEVRAETRGTAVDLGRRIDELRAESRASVGEVGRRIDEVRNDAHAADVDIDRRLNEATNNAALTRRETDLSRAIGRREIDASIAALKESVSVLNAQILFFGARAPPAPVGVRK